LIRRRSAPVRPTQQNPTSAKTGREKEARLGKDGDKTRHGMPFARERSIMRANGRYPLQPVPFDFS
jgi:hypothetical protein